LLHDDYPSGIWGERCVVMGQLHAPSGFAKTFPGSL